MKPMQNHKGWNYHLQVKAFTTHRQSWKESPTCLLACSPWRYVISNHHRGLGGVYSWMKCTLVSNKHAYLHLLTWKNTSFNTSFFFLVDRRSIEIILFFYYFIFFPHLPFDQNTLKRNPLNSQPGSGASLIDWLGFPSTTTTTTTTI